MYFKTRTFNKTSCKNLVKFNSNSATNILPMGIKQCFWHTHRLTDRQTEIYRHKYTRRKYRFSENEEKPYWYIGFNVFSSQKEYKKQFYKFGVLMPGLESLLDTQIIHYIKMMEAEF